MTVTSFARWQRGAWRELRGREVRGRELRGRGVGGARGQGSEQGLDLEGSGFTVLVERTGFVRQKLPRIPP
eukprot:632264-Rhodomonas_salina.1